MSNSSGEHLKTHTYTAGAYTHKHNIDGCSQAAYGGDVAAVADSSEDGQAGSSFGGQRCVRGADI